MGSTYKHLGEKKKKIMNTWEGKKNKEKKNWRGRAPNVS